MNFAKITWETISADQRLVLLALDAARRERVRMTALRASPLFKVITEMHVPSAIAAEDVERKRTGVERYRLREQGAVAPVPTYGVPGSAAAALTESDTARRAIVDPVQASGGDLNRFANRTLAEWVQAQGEERAVKALHNLACGLTNLYALALAHGVAKTSQPGRPPTVDDTVAWLRDWSLDAPPGKRLLTGSRARGLGYDPTVITRAISRTGSRPTFSTAFERPEPSREAGKQFGAFMQRHARAAGKQATHDARLALAQGKASTHSFLIYKDIDGVWRTMDVYLGLEDLTEFALGFPRHSRTVTALYFVIDPTTIAKAGTK
jgi:hypothetical protein